MSRLPERVDPVRRRLLKAALAGGGLLASGGLAWGLCARAEGRDFRPERAADVLSRVTPLAPGEPAPNIVLIVADDLGYGDLSCYGSTAIETPTLDGLAAQGARLTGFYACAPLCSPSRAALLSGRYSIRTHVTVPLYPTWSPHELFMNVAGARPYGVSGIPEDEVLLPELLKARGYRTGLVGKWHLGDRSPHLPNENGFDLFFGAYYSNSTKPYAIYRNQEVAIPAPADQDVLTQQLTAEAVDFITANRGRPFFLTYAQPFPHEPLHASTQARGRSIGGLYGDVVQEIDWSVGRVLSTLDDLGLSENTIVIFTSDNGPWWQGDPGGMRGRKNLPFEGGYRVPFIARWPGVVPAEQVIDGPSMNFDVFPTLLAAAGVAVPDDRAIDGYDMRPLLRGEVDRLHDTLYYYKWHRLLGVRQGDWKYLRRHMTDNGGYASLRQGPFLFNLATDPTESYSLLESEPAVAAELEATAAAWDDQMDRNVRGWKDGL
ncbi:MAG: sulfatase [Anaerolineae bacterium]|nr:sulfatase [Anaerolineae bacterium]